MPFGVKLAVALSTIAVSVTSISVYGFYSITHKVVLQQMAERLKDVGRTGSFLFDAADRERLKRLTQTTAEQSLPVKPIIQTLQDGTSAMSLSEPVAEQLMRSEDFQQTVQLLRQINAGSRQKILPLSNFLAQTTAETPDPPTVMSYLYVRIPESPDGRIVKFIASSAYQPLGSWAGNPLGNLYAPIDPIFFTAFEGSAQVSEQFYTDQFGTLLAAGIPIKDPEGQVIAVLGIDCDVSSNLNQLRQLRYLCFSIIAISFIGSILLALLIARQLVRPITELQAGAERVRTRDFSTLIPVNSHDEFGALAEAFNAMVTEIQSYAGTLELKNEELETRIEERTTQLQQTRKFLANMSHELRTPLNGILGYTQILQRDKTPTAAQQKDGLNTIYQCSSHLLMLIDDLLDFSKLEAHKLELISHDFHWQTFLNGIVDLCRLKATQKQITFTYDCHDPLPIAVHADEKRLRQVLINLLGNAIKFTDQGSVCLQVQKLNHHGSAYTLRFQIEDTGIGIASQQLEKIFLPFEQVGEQARKAEGTGLGLSISQQIVQLMGSQIQVRSELGQGSTFWFDVDLTIGEDWIIGDPLVPNGSDAEGIEPLTELVSPPQFIVPNAAELAELHTAARIGDIQAIEQEALRIQALDAAYLPFTRKLLELTQQLDEEAILQLVQRALPMQI